MKKLTQITLASIATLSLIGCGDSYNDNKDEDVAAPTKAELKASNRNAKYLVDTDAMSLYIFDKDILNKSNCDAVCQKIWPLFEGANSGSEDIKVLEGTDHLAYRKHPLYYFVNDKAPGDILGNNVKEVWHLVYALKDTTDNQTAQSDTMIKQNYLTNKDGMALYTFDKDDINISRCTGKQDTKPLNSCEARWPVFYAADLGTLPVGTKASDFGTIDRPEDTLKDADGKPLATKQTTYKGLPLYYWFKDEKAGDVSGDWVNGVWHLVELSSNKVEATLGDIAAGKVIFENKNKCASCHGANGKDTVGGGNDINLAADKIYRNAATVEERLKDMKGANSLDRVARMVRVAKGLNDTQIKNLSAYIATLKK
jgi:predicted lipoprotein with Yx(FWY)xxD motif/cytochrome c551/c552